MDKKEEEKVQSNNGVIIKDSPKPSEDIPASSGEVMVPKVSGESYFGKWRRIGMVINNEDVSFSPSMIDIGEGNFSQTTDCTVSGNLSVTGNQMLMEVIEDGCGQGEKSFINNYSLSEDNNKLVLLIDEPGFKVQDIYQRTNK
jgi:hypothetical protein